MCKTTILVVILFSKEKEMKEQKPYLKYKGKFEKQNLYSIIFSVLAIIGILLFIFAPFFRISFRNLNENQSYTYVNSGIITLEDLSSEGKNFSIFNDFMFIMNHLDFSKDIDYVIFLVGIFTVYTVIFSAIYLIIEIIKLFRTISERNDNSYMIKYAQIKKSGDKKEKNQFFKNNILLSIVFYIVFSIIYGKIFAPMLIGSNNLIVSYMCALNDISIFIILPVIILIAYIALLIIKSKEEKALKIAIIQEDMEESMEKEENKQNLSTESVTETTSQINEETEINPVDELKKLKQLFDDGIIDKETYDAKSQKYTSLL